MVIIGRPKGPSGYMRFLLKWEGGAGISEFNNWEEEFIRKEIKTSSLHSDREIRDLCISRI